MHREVKGNPREKKFNLETEETSLTCLLAKYVVAFLGVRAL